MAGLDEITRVRYFDRQFLGAVDFRAEQTYERDARRRALGVGAARQIIDVPPHKLGAVHVGTNPVGAGGPGRTATGGKVLDQDSQYV